MQTIMATFTPHAAAYTQLIASLRDALPKLCADTPEILGYRLLSLANEQLVAMIIYDSPASFMREEPKLLKHLERLHHLYESIKYERAVTLLSSPDYATLKQDMDNQKKADMETPHNAAA
ncbi:MAG: hypothetical protein K2Q12_07940 [Rickettsiales bacterium]|nr:hypothetical protein [Rickettsiales bacterium]